jgi:hypothetical protein
MIYIIAICLSFLAGFACGSLFYRNNVKKLTSTEVEGRKLLDALKNK